MVQPIHPINEGLARLAVGGGSRFLGVSSGGIEVHHQDPLHLDCGLMSQRLVRLGRGGCLLVSEIALPLHYLMLSVVLLIPGSRSLPLPKSAPSFEREATVRPRF
jgi:hypothetical protein